LSLTPTKPTKEYIYAGGKLVATEEPTVFNDVPVTHPFYAEIGKIAAKEITNGTSATTYGPEDAVTRGQMAVFIERALGFYQPPSPPATPTFQDVPKDHPFYAFIEHFYTQHITSGCAAGYYCPDY